MTNLELFNILRPIIIQVTGIPECIKSNPNEPAPSGSYAAIQVQQSITQRGQAIIYRANNGTQNLDVDPRAQLIAECAINFYRGDAHNFAQRVAQANKIPSVQAALFAANVGWQKVGPINNLNFLQSNNWENRAQISVFLMYEEPALETINSIEQADISVEAFNTDETAFETLITEEIKTPDAP